MFFSNKSTTKKIASLISIILVSTMFFCSCSKKSTNYDTENIDKNKFTLTQDRTDKPIVYIKNGALFSKSSDGTGKAYELSSNLCQNNVIETSDVYINLVKQSKNADYTYFIKDYTNGAYKGSLYATADYKTSFFVDSDVVVETEYEYLKLSDDGKTALYMKNLTVTDSEVYADLYYKNADEETSREIEKGLYGMQTSYEISNNGRFIAAFSETNQETSAGGFIALENKGETKKLPLEDNAYVVIKNVTDDGKVIYVKTFYTDGGTTSSSLCITDILSGETKTYGKDVSVNGVFVSEKSDKTVYIDNADDKIFAYSVNFNSEPALITDKYCGFTGIDVENECYIYAEAEGDEFYAEKKKVYIKTPELTETALLCDNIYLPSDVSASVDFKNVYYLSNYDSSNRMGELHKVSVKDNALADETKISDNVHSFKVSQGGTAVLFDTDYNTEDKKSNVKVYSTKDSNIKNIRDGIEIDYAILSPDGQAVFFNDKPVSDLGINFCSTLQTFDIYKNDDCRNIDDKMSCAYYYYDLYLSETSQDSSSTNMRNGYYVRAKDNALYYKNVSTDFKGADLYIYKNGKSTLVDNDVTALLFE